MKQSQSFLPLLTLFCLLCQSCNKGRPQEILVDLNTPLEADSSPSTSSPPTADIDTLPIRVKMEKIGERVIVPYREEGGVKVVAVRLNGIPMDMIFDTGASETLISLAEARYLAQKGRLSQDDIIGSTQTQVADGSIVENGVINLREVIVGDGVVVNNVQAFVSTNVNAPLLLGNGVLDRTASYTIDPQQHCITFQLK